MTRGERILSHQIHPAKLATDWLATPAAVYLLWRRRPAAGLAAAFVPSAIASWLVLRLADLAPLERSPAGRYVRRSMTPAMVAVRAAGGITVLAGGWLRRPSLLLGGVLLVLYGWLRGLWRRPATTSDAGP